MPPEIPPMCGVMTCDHEEPGKVGNAAHYSSRYDNAFESRYACQQPLGACLIHGGEQSDKGEAWTHVTP